MWSLKDKPCRKRVPVNSFETVSFLDGSSCTAAVLKLDIQNETSTASRVGGVRTAARKEEARISKEVGECRSKVETPARTRSRANQRLDEFPGEDAVGSRRSPRHPPGDGRHGCHLVAVNEHDRWRGQRDLSTLIRFIHQHGSLKVQRIAHRDRREDTGNDAARMNPEASFFFQIHGIRVLKQDIGCCAKECDEGGQYWCTEKHASR